MEESEGTVNTTVEVRVDPSSPTALAVWAKSAGRCALCAESVLNQTPFYHSTLTGEVAHNVGATSGPRSPRGQSPLEAKERAHESNLLLLCHDCHRLIDDQEKRGVYTVDMLHAKKQEHEYRVARATDFSNLKPTALITLDGTLRETEFITPWRSVIPALLQNGLTAANDSGVLCHEHIVLNDREDRSFGWELGQSDIDRAVARTKDWIERLDLDCISVFAIAPIPLLGYLGSCLDDIADVRIFQKHRHTSSPWEWKKDAGSSIDFSFQFSRVDFRSTDVVAVLSLSGVPEEDQFPTSLQKMPRLDFQPHNAAQSPELISTQADLGAFTTKWLQALAALEHRLPKCSRLHIVAAVPNSTAIRLGQSRMQSVHPSFVMYQRTSTGTYQDVIEIGDSVK